MIQEKKVVHSTSGCLSSDVIASSQSAAPAEVRIHKRAVLLGLVLVIAISCIAPYVDLVVGQMQTGTLQFAPGAVGAFIIVYGLTRLARARGWLTWLNSADLLVVYTMLLVGVFVSTRGLLEKILPTIAYLNEYATTSNSYRAFLVPHLNPDLVVGSPSGPAQQFAARAYFNGVGREVLPWNAWLAPCASWFVLCALVIFAFLCLSTLLRKQWSDVERLSFPLTVLPLRVFDDSDSAALFKNPLTWLGILVPFVIYTINGLHQSVPIIPQIPLQFDNIQQSLTTPPWNQIQSTTIYISFAVIGFSYLVPTDLLFSFWFFFFLTRLGDVVATSMGLDLPVMASYPTRAYLGYQAAGAYVALAGIFLYEGRRIYLKTLKDALYFRADENDSEMMPRRTALWGLIFCYTGIVAWTVWAGMSLWLAGLIWLIYLFVTSLVLARGVAEVGFLMTETTFRPGDIIGLLVNPATLGGGNITTLSLLNATFFRDMRGLFLALFMDVQQMATGVRMKRRGIVAPIALAVLVAFVAGVSTHLRLSYGHGAINLYSYGTANAASAFADANATLNHTRPAFPSARCWFGVGIGVVLLLTRLRSTFIGFPLCPIGYALAPSYTMMVIWFPVLLVSIVKPLILRYGSSKAYRQFMPFFLGLIVGEFGSVALWAILASVFKVMAPPLPLGG